MFGKPQSISIFGSPHHNLRILDFCLFIKFLLGVTLEYLALHRRSVFKIEISGPKFMEDYVHCFLEMLAKMPCFMVFVSHPWFCS